jgi:hypothetical protein
VGLAQYGEGWKSLGFDGSASRGLLFMIAKVARFASIMLESFNFGMSFAHVLEMGPKRELHGPEYAVVQRIYRRYGRAGSVTTPGAISATLLSGALSRDQWKTNAAAAACIAATVGIWWFLNEPVNREVVEWKPDDLPDDWDQRRDQWEYAHATSAALHAFALGLVVAGAVREGRR